MLFTLASVVGVTGAAVWDKAKIAVQSIGADDRKTLIESGTDGRYVSTGHIVYTLNGTLFAVPFDIRRLEKKARRYPSWKA